MTDDYPHAPLASRKAPGTLTEPGQESVRAVDPLIVTAPSASGADSRLTTGTDPGSVSVQGHRLFAVNGTPTLSAADRALLRQANKMLRNLDTAHDLLVTAVREDDPVRCATAVKSLLGIALHLNDYTDGYTGETA